MTTLDWVQLITSAAAVVSAVIVLVSLPRLVSQRLDQWTGRPAAPGFPAIPGIPERVQATEEAASRIERTLEAHGRQLTEVHHEVHPNSGSSLRDAVSRIERHLEDATGDRADLRSRLEQLDDRMDASEADRRALHALIEGKDLS